MTVPGYTDVSHFRAPYKNSYIYTGVGAYGQDVAPSPEGSMANATEIVKDVVRWRPEVSDVIITGLKGYSAVWLSDRAVQLVPLDANPLDAQTWLEQQLAAGNVVFATPGVIFPVAGAVRQLAAVPKSDKETIKMTSHIAPVLATPSLLAGLGTPLAVAGVAVVGGLAAWAIYAGFKSKKAV